MPDDKASGRCNAVADGTGERAGRSIEPLSSLGARGGAGQTCRFATDTRASASSAAEANLAAGSWASARLAVSTSAAGKPGSTVSRGTTGCVEMWYRMALWDSPG